MAGRATRAKIVSQYKGGCIVTGHRLGRRWAHSWALDRALGRTRRAAGAGGARAGRAGSKRALGGLGSRRWEDWALGAGRTGR